MRNLLHFWGGILFSATLLPSTVWGQEHVIGVWNDPHAIIAAMARTTFTPYVCPAESGGAVTVSLPSQWRAGVQSDGRVVFQSTYHVGVMAVLKRIAIPLQTEDAEKTVIKQWAESRTIAMAREIAPLNGPLNDASKPRRAYVFSGRVSGEIWRFAVVISARESDALFLVFQIPDAWFNAYLPVIEVMGQI